MKIRVDRSVCQGHALCNARDAELFTLDSYGYSDVDVREVPAGKEDRAVAGMQVCPERAIAIEE
jgi:ferredoxin